jgi:hypothetical protein
LVDPSGGCTQSEGETLDLLLATHFPNSAVLKRGAVPAAARPATRLDGNDCHLLEGGVGD